MPAWDTVTGRFPLVARPRPRCGPLAERVAHLRSQAAAAYRDGDQTAASAVLNQAALIASDCGLPDVARTWCHRHAQLYLLARPLDAPAARSALEPLVNLARLRIRAGDGAAAYRLLDDLYHAASQGVDTTIDGLTVPTATLLAPGADHHAVRQWLWSMHLSDGTRALTSAGRWHVAYHHLRRHNGVGRRMLDGRQVAIIAHLKQCDARTGLAVANDTAPGEEWETVVTVCLIVLCRRSLGDPADEVTTTILDQYRRLSTAAPLAVFHTRLGLTVIDIIGGIHDPAARNLANELTQRTIDDKDGYAARDILTHDGCDTLIASGQRHLLAGIVEAAGLDRMVLPGELTRCVTTAEAVISRSLPGPALSELEEPDRIMHHV